MKPDLISPKTRMEFREYLVGWTVREISHEFESAGIVRTDLAYEDGYGVRRATVDEYYASLDFTNPADVRRLLQTYEYILARVSDQHPDALDHLCRWLELDGYVFSGGRIIPKHALFGLADLNQASVHFDSNYFALQIGRIEADISDDPASAIGEAKDLLESCCKIILSERRVNVERNPSLQHLMRVTMKELNLVPEDIPESAKGAEVIRVLLNNLGTIAQHISTLRNLYGSGHGRDGKWNGLQPRHAKLAAGSALTAALFLMETHQQTSPPQATEQ